MIMIIKIRTEHHGCVNIRAFKFDIADGIGICSLRICGLFGIAETFCILIDYGVIRKMTAKLFDICRINGIRLCGIAQYICRLKLNGIELNIAAEVSGEKICIGGGYAPVHVYIAEDDRCAAVSVLKRIFITRTN